MNQTTRRWWARLAGSEYGRWVPTGCMEQADACDYMRAVYPGRPIEEWLLL